MRLRTQVLCCSIALLFGAVAVCCTLLYLNSWRRARTELRTALVSEQRLLLRSYQYALSASDAGQDAAAERAFARYCFDGLAASADADTQYVLQTDAGALYNNAGFDPVLALARGGDPVRESGQTAAFAAFAYGGSYYGVCTSEFSRADALYSVSVVRDATGMRRDNRELLWRCAAIGVGTAALSACWLALLLRRFLRPVQTLHQGAADLAAGQYRTRIEVTGADELAALASRFNDMAAAIEARTRETERTSEERRMLLAALSHEMKTPVTAISGYAHALRSAPLTAEQQKEAVFHIDAQCRRLERLSGKLVQLISLEGDSIALSPLPSVELASLLEQALFPVARERGVVLSITAIPTVYEADADLLVCLCANLFDNAAKAGAGEVHIRLAADALTVSDDGRGVPPEQLPLITQPFYQGDASRSAEGFGLGLALCKRIAERHGALLCLDSRVGVGTTAAMRWISLP